MSRWIVFITVVREEVTFTADQHSDGERSVATYPLLAVPTRETAELVAARMNHLHGVPEESGSDDWQEFTFKAEPDLTPQEVAMTLNLNDPAYPRNGRQPKWVSEMVGTARTALNDVSLPPRTAEMESPQKQDMEPDPQSVADVVVLFMVTRDLARVGRDYPDAMSEADQKAWVEEVTAHAEVILKRPGFESIKKLMKSPTLLELDVPERFGILMSAAMMAHPAMSAGAEMPIEIQAAADKAMSTCQATASQPVQAQVSRLANLMVVSCRCPTATAVKEFADPARFLQMLHRYWMLASAMVQTQATVHVGFSPHPLLHLIENIRDRLSTCFSHVAHLDGAGEAQQACDQLVGMLTDGDIDDLSAVPEWTNGELQRVERFIARARLKLGPRVFELTAAEEFFVNQAERIIAEHEKRCRAAWKQMLAQADAQAAARRPIEGLPTTTLGSGTASPQPTGTLEQRVARVGPLLSSLVAVDNGIMLLGARLRSLASRGKAADMYALTVKVQEQLHSWVDPLVQHLKDAETASNGVGPYLVGLIAEPVAWEVDTRLAIRTLTDQLIGLIYSNGGETEESYVVGAASSLCDRGQRLQAAFEAIRAQVTQDQSPEAQNGVDRASNAPVVRKVELGRLGDPCTVNGRQMKALTDGQHAVVAALLDAGDDGLTKDAIEAVRPSARRMLNDLRQDTDWAAVIIMPGRTNGRYRVRR